MRFGWIAALSVEMDSSFWKDLWNTVFADETKYEYLEKGAISLTSLRMLIVGIFIGLSLACFAAVFNKRVLGDFVRKASVLLQLLLHIRISFHHMRLKEYSLVIQPVRRGTRSTIFKIIWFIMFLLILGLMKAYLNCQFTKQEWDFIQEEIKSRYHTMISMEDLSAYEEDLSAYEEEPYVLKKENDMESIVPCESINNSTITPLE